MQLCEFPHPHPNVVVTSPYGQLCEKKMKRSVPDEFEHTAVKKTKHWDNPYGIHISDHDTFPLVDTSDNGPVVIDLIDFSSGSFYFPMKNRLREQSKLRVEYINGRYDFIKEFNIHDIYTDEQIELYKDDKDVMTFGKSNCRIWYTQKARLI